MSNNFPNDWYLYIFDNKNNYNWFTKTSVILNQLVYVLKHCSSSPPWVSWSSYTIATKKTRSCQSMLYITTYAALWQNDSICWVSYEQVLNIFVNIVIQFNILTGLKVCIYTKRFWRKLNVPWWLRSILIRNAQIGTLLAVVISNSQQ